MTWIVDDWRAALTRDGRVALMPSRRQARVCLGLAALLAVLGVWAGIRGGWLYGAVVVGLAAGVAVVYTLRLARPRPLVVVTASGIELRRHQVRWDEIDRIDATYRSSTDISIDLKTPVGASPLRQAGMYDAAERADVLRFLNDELHARR
ncbi:MAG: hypothetical protein ABWX84_12745 [Nocardioides sp.]